ncbi:MAG TPA: hypothetical protein VE046_00925 [Steroidobacteraceae bacterium]|nr:hypothetical protein [Steroidobacteraceae bacterium]
MIRTRTAALALIAALVLAACASEPPKPIVKEKLSERSATVTAIDYQTRLITLRGTSGNSLTLVVDDSAKNFNQVKVDDKVTVSYYQGFAAEVKKPGTGVKGVEETATGGIADPGERPAAGVGAMIRTTVIIESVDTSFDTVTFRRHDGAVRTIAISDPNIRKAIHDLKKGDEVEVTYVEAVAIEVTPAGE